MFELFGTRWTVAAICACSSILACASGTIPSAASGRAKSQEATEPSPAIPKTVDESAIDPAADQEMPPGYPSVETKFEIQNSWKRLGADEIWVDREKHLVIVGGHICLRAGALEMFACPQHTKEHESVVATHTSAKFVHAALLAVGANPGTTVRFDPHYKPATGARVKISVRWMLDGKLQEVPAQQMVRDVATGNPMTHQWLFVGSGTWKNPDTDEEYYLADGGELICVSNFGNATLDLPIESSSAANGLLFEAFTENIPDLETLVLLVLEADVDSPADQPAPDQGQKLDHENPSPPAGERVKS